MSNRTFKFTEEQLTKLVDNMFTIQIEACRRAGKLESLKRMGRKHYGDAMRDSKLDAKATFKFLTRDS